MSEKYAFWVTLRPQSDCCHQGEAKIRILDFKTTWLEFQKPSQNAAMQGEAELRILDLKTTWSEFNMSSQTAATRGEAELHILNFKTTWSAGLLEIWTWNFEVGYGATGRATAAKAKPRCIYSILKPHGQSFITSRVVPKPKAVVCVSTPRMYLRSGYFLVTHIYVITCWSSIPLQKLS